MPLKPPAPVSPWCVLAMCSVPQVPWFPISADRSLPVGRSPSLTRRYRYFMTIPEAASLVLQSSVLAQGGDVFLLDMGEPVRIKSLAEQMVRLSGLSLRDAAHPDGDIEIVCTGLRPGEKLYEELLIEAESQPTEHPLIYRAKERSVSPEALWSQLPVLESAIAVRDVKKALDLLSALVPEWRRGKM